LLYLLFYVVGFMKYRNGMLAYMHNRFEVEAYNNESNKDYLITRRRWSWINERDLNKKDY